MCIVDAIGRIAGFIAKRLGYRKNYPWKSYYCHGDKMRCPSCGAPGCYDKKKRGKFSFDDAVYYNERLQEWECYACWLK